MSFLELSHVSKTYFTKTREHRAVNRVSFTIASGEIVALLGVNGAGKTTVSSMIASLISPTSGDILWKGNSIYQHLMEYRYVMGFCPQHNNLDANLSLHQNLLFHGYFYGIPSAVLEKRIDALLDRFHLHEYAKDSVATLSGGYKQRFLLVRALLHQPQFLILDEPTVGLDPQVRRHLWEYIRSCKKENIAVLLTTHYLDEAEMLADRVCVMDRGMIKVMDSPGNLKESCHKKNLEEVFLHLLEGDE